jgi:hypothetical protein
MKVKDLIERLKDFDQELPVCLGDWQEQYAAASEDAAEYIVIAIDVYRPSDFNNIKTGQFVQIGPGRDA